MATDSELIKFLSPILFFLISLLFIVMKSFSDILIDLWDSSMLTGLRWLAGLLTEME